MDDVVDLSVSSNRDSVSLSNATVRDLQALTQNAGLTITPAPPSTVTNGKLILFVLLVLLFFFRFVFSSLFVRFLACMYSILCIQCDFSIHFENNIEPYSRRVLRPRTEPKSYAEAPDIVLLPAKVNGRQQNGNIDSDTDDEEMPPIIAIKVRTFFD